MTAVSDIPFVPKGLECRWLINTDSGYTVALNDREDESQRYVITEIGGLWDADLRLQTEVIPNEHGEIPGAAYYGGRTLTFTGYIQAPNMYVLREMQNNLKLALQQLSEFRCQMDSGDTLSSATFMARKAAMIDGTESQTSLYHRRNFMVSLRLSDPRFYSVDENSAFYQPSLAAVLGAVFPRRFNLVFATQMNPDGHIASAGSAFSISNQGNFESQPRWVFDGPISNPTVTHIETGEVMRLNMALANDEQITVDTATKVIYDQDGNNRFGIWQKGNHWLRLLGGSNDYTITVSAFQGGSVTVYWRDAFL